MKPKLLVLCLVLALSVPCLPQTNGDGDPVVQVQARAGAFSWFWKFILRPSVVLTALSCDKTELEPGESSTCTVTLNRAARVGGFLVGITMPAELSGPTTILVPAGQNNATFTVTRPQTVSGSFMFHTQDFPSVRSTVRGSIWATYVPEQPPMFALFFHKPGL